MLAQLVNIIHRGPLSLAIKFHTTFIVKFIAVLPLVQLVNLSTARQSGKKNEKYIAMSVFFLILRSPSQFLQNSDIARGKNNFKKKFGCQVNNPSIFFPLVNFFIVIVPISDYVWIVFQKNCSLKYNQKIPCILCGTISMTISLILSTDWSTRVKQIAKLWRKASSQDRAPYVVRSLILLNLPTFLLQS